MKTIIKFPIIFACIFIMLSCKKNNVNPDIVTDFDGNVYHTIKIGTQVWMVENLKVSHYRNGDAIPNVSGDGDWTAETTGAYSDYNNMADSSNKYGRLYNWYVVNDTRKIAPEGWHVPSDAEWTILTTYLGGESIAGDKMKDITLWTFFNGVVNTNSSGFTGLPAGIRNYFGFFGDIGMIGYFWSSTEANNGNAWFRNLNYNDSNASRTLNVKQYGLSVRCIKD